jgi:glycosyltransferase involved in cell wall biosynthesis
MYRPSISVVICTYNRAESLSDTLRGVGQLDYPDYEVIVVNGPSHDSTESLLVVEQKGLVKAIKCSSRNISASRNIGVAAAGGEIVAFIDDDAVPHPKWLSFLAPKYADERVGGVGGFTVDNTGQRFQSRKVLCDRYGNAHSVSAMFDERPFSRIGSPLYPSLLGTNSSFRRNALERIGGFDNTFSYFLDETDVCLRLVDVGYLVVFEPSALVFHQFAPSHLRTPHRVKRTYYPIALSKAYFIIRHGCAQSVEQAGRELVAFREKVLSENELLLQGGAITEAHRVSLDQDVLRGISDGTRAAMAAAQVTRGDLARASVEPSFAKALASKHMRVALVSQNFSPLESTGIGRWTWMLAKGLTERGHIVHVITRGNEPSTRFANGYWTHSLPDDPIAGEIVAIEKKIPHAIASRAAAVCQALRYAKSFGIDLVSFPIWDVEGIGIVDEPDVSVVMSLHTTFGLARPYVKEWGVRPLQAHFEVEPTIAAEHRLLKEVPHILGNSKAIVADLAQLSGAELSSKTTVVPHGTPDPFVLRSERRAMRKPDGHPIKLAYVGRFEPRKGFDIAALVFDRLLQMGLDISVEMVGDEVSPQIATSLASLGVTRLLVHKAAKVGGFADRERLDDLLSSAHAVLMPSRYASFGLVAIEAMAAGAPVVALRSGGLSEVIEDGISGRLVNSDGNEVAAIVEILADIVRDPTLRTMLSKGARETFDRRFRIDLMIDGVEDAFRAALRQR